MILLQNVRAIKTGLTAYFQASGGTPPYTYAVLPDGDDVAGGSINSSGLYTSPERLGVDTIQVTDDEGVRAKAQIMVGGPINFICDIIEREMSLQRGRVYLWDQKVNIGKDDGVYVSVGILSCKAFGNSNRMNSSGEEVQSVNMQAQVSITIESRSMDAVTRKEEILMALKSQYSQQQQALNSFGIAGLPTSFLNVSEVDGEAIPYQFNIVISMQYFVTKTKAVDYYDTFSNVSVITDPELEEI